MEGLMTGKIDLFFRHGGKFYLLDWKSNYLGETADAYDLPNMQEAMNVNNYHLQYHIYTVAAVKYLSQKMQDFDYAKHFGGVCYLFVRGVRTNQQTGIYLARPTWETIRQLSGLLIGNH
jgi:exodeoxyribonuclease V beta subunit